MINTFNFIAFFWIYIIVFGVFKFLLNKSVENEKKEGNYYDKDSKNKFIRYYPLNVNDKDVKQNIDMFCLFWPIFMPCTLVWYLLKIAYNKLNNN